MLTPAWGTPSSLQVAWRTCRVLAIAWMPEAALQRAVPVACPAQGLCCILLWVGAQRKARAWWLGLTTHVELGMGGQARCCFLWPRKTAIYVCFP